MTKLTGILIDPWEKRIKEVEVSQNDITDIYKLLDIQVFTVVGLSDSESLFIDDEGLFKNDQRFFYTELYPHNPLAGKGLILGLDRASGDSKSTRFTVEELENKVMWISDPVQWMRKEGML